MSRSRKALSEAFCSTTSRAPAGRSKVAGRSRHHLPSASERRAVHGGAGVVCGVGGDGGVGGWVGGGEVG